MKSAQFEEPFQRSSASLAIAEGEPRGKLPPVSGRKLIQIQQ